MKQFLTALDKGMTPVLSLTYLAVCLIVLTVIPAGTGGIYLLMTLWAIALMILMRWGIWGILRMAQKQYSTLPPLRRLVRLTEIVELVLFVGAVIWSILLWELPMLWLFVPIPLFGFQGALHFDLLYVIK